MYRTCVYCEYFRCYRNYLKTVTVATRNRRPRTTSCCRNFCWTTQKPERQGKLKLLIYIPPHQPNPAFVFFSLLFFFAMLISYIVKDKPFDVSFNPSPFSISVSQHVFIYVFSSSSVSVCLSISLSLSLSPSLYPSLSLKVKFYLHGIFLSLFLSLTLIRSLTRTNH